MKPPGLTFHFPAQGQVVWVIILRWNCSNSNIIGSLFSEITTCFKPLYLSLLSRIIFPRAGLDNPAFSPSPIKPRPPPSDFDYHSSSSSSSSPSPPSLVKAKKKDTSMLSSLRSFLVVLALSVHSIFEGMAIGDNLRRTEKTTQLKSQTRFRCMGIEKFDLSPGMEGSEAGVWKLFLAVAIHRCPSQLLIRCANTSRFDCLNAVFVLFLISPTLQHGHCVLYRHRDDHYR